MKVVSERNDNQIAADRARSHLAWATKELASNLLRIIAGAGKPYGLTDQLNSVADGINTLVPHTGGAYSFHPSNAMAEALCDLDWRADHPGYHAGKPRSEQHQESLRLEDAVFHASLRIIAARLVRQPTQEATAKNKFHDALRQLDEYQQKDRRQFYRGAG